jgi:hypothetical protein
MSIGSLSNPKVRFVFGSAIAILAFMGALSYRSIAASSESDRRVQHTRDVLENLLRLSIAIDGLSSSIGRFVNTAKNQILFPIVQRDSMANGLSHLCGTRLWISGHSLRKTNKDRQMQRVVHLVEDSPGDVRLTEEAFRDAGRSLDLRVASDGVEAIAFLKREGVYANAPRPDFILLDLNRTRESAGVREEAV